MYAEGLIVPDQIDRDGVAGNAGLGPCQQPLLAEQPIDQRRFPAIGAADHGDADRFALSGLLFDIAAARLDLGRKRGWVT